MVVTQSQVAASYMLLFAFTKRSLILHLCTLM